MVKRAGLKPAAAICEILNDDGTMARLKDVKELSVKLGIPLLCFSELKR
jgi:3,4-dihydroxy 2-butanone 4-phosphate synthase/GTP cyclohydrolase II